MTMHDAALITASWSRSPPTPVLLLAIAVALGMKPPERTTVASEPKKYMTADEFALLLRVTNKGQNL